MVDTRNGAKEIFLACLEASPNERDARLADLEASDAGLAERVRSLLSAHERAERVLTDTLTQMPAKALDPEALPGARIGAYTLEHELGSGGFGSVWLATQERPIERQVALKLLKPGMDTREVVARFESERRTLARMDHRGIARIYDAGATDRGRPYFVMERVEGTSITRYAHEQGLGLQARLELFIEVCRAVGHAHTKGVVHRDLKPSNVLVGGDGAPKVIDFGIAKAVAGDGDASSVRTRVDQIVGSPAYMAPEQVRGDGDVDTRTDVYGLGALLYELLVGVPPLDKRTLTSGGTDELRALVQQFRPKRPSARLDERMGAEEAAGPVQPRELRGDLDWIVLRCLEKEPERRYESVAVLANEIERHLDGQPVLAGPPTLTYRLSKFARRNARALVLIAAVFVGLVVAIAVVDNEARRAKDAEARERTEARNARRAEREALAAEAEARAELVRANAANDFLEDLLMSVDPAVARGTDATLLLAMLARSSARVEEVSRGLPLVEADLRRVIGGAYFALARYEEAVENLERALALRRRELGDEHPDSLALAAQLAPALGETGRVDDALALHAWSVDAMRSTFGALDDRTLRGVSNHGALLVNLKRFAEAVPMLEEAERVCLATVGPDSDATITVMNNLATAYGEIGRHEEARERLRTAYLFQLEERGAHAPRTLAALNNLIGTLQTLGEDQEVVELYAEVLEGKREVLDPGHPSLVIGLNNLAGALEQVERWEEAEPLRVEAYASAREVLGLENQYTLIALHNLARMLGTIERHAEAEAHWRELWEPGLAVFGEGSDLHLSACDGLARSLYARRVQLDEALELYATALTWRRGREDGDAQSLDALAARHELVRLALGHEEAAGRLRALVPELREHGLVDLPNEVDEALAAADEALR